MAQRHAGVHRHAVHHRFFLEVDAVRVVRRGLRRILVPRRHAEEDEDARRPALEVGEILRAGVHRGARHPLGAARGAAAVSGEEDWAALGEDVRSEFQWAWRHYRKLAWGKDEIVRTEKNGFIVLDPASLEVLANE